MAVIALSFAVRWVVAGISGGDDGGQVSNGRSENGQSVPLNTATPSKETGPPFDPDKVRMRAVEVGTGFDQPLQVTYAPDGSGRIYVVEKPGRVRLLDGSPFLDIRDRVLSSPLFSYEREQGMHSIAFHPKYKDNGYFYVHYIDRKTEHVISRFRVGANGRGDPSTEKILLKWEQPEVNFVGGSIAFGADGYLYIATGVGGTADDLQRKSQDLNSLFGKMLRIDVDSGAPYGIPKDNPFAGQQGKRGEIWAYGLRNPWRFSWDRATGDLYLGGPGEFKREWINFQSADMKSGQNFGWPMFEGTLCTRKYVNSCDTSGINLPIIEQTTYENGNCVILGGHVYRGKRYPLLNGAYLYGDFCTSRIWAAWRDSSGKWTNKEMMSLGTLLSSFGEDEDGEVYAVDIQFGSIYRLAGEAR